MNCFFRNKFILTYNWCKVGRLFIVLAILLVRPDFSSSIIMHLAIHMLQKINEGQAILTRYIMAHILGQPNCLFTNIIIIE